MKHNIATLGSAIYSQKFKSFQNAYLYWKQAYFMRLIICMAY